MIESILIKRSGISNELKTIAEKIIASERINIEEGLLLYEKADLFAACTIGGSCKG